VPHRKLQGKDIAAHLLTINSEFAACREFMQMLPIPSWMLDEQVRFMFINPVAERFFRLGHQQGIGMTPAELGFLSPAQVAALRRAVLDLRRRRRSAVSFRELRFEHEPTIRFSVLRFPIWTEDDVFFAGAIAVPHGKVP
jgi:PAS domain-containing protein